MAGRRAAAFDPMRQIDCHMCPTKLLKEKKNDVGQYVTWWPENHWEKLTFT